jgi:hypothetical protein
VTAAAHDVILHGKAACAEEECSKPGKNKAICGKLEIILAEDILAL